MHNRCDNCRRLKEKCNGAEPCARCLRFTKKCVFSDAFKKKRIRPSKRKRDQGSKLGKPTSPSMVSSSKILCDTGRLEALERMAKHLTGTREPSQAQLDQALEALKNGDQKSPLPGSRDFFEEDSPALRNHWAQSEDGSKSGGRSEPENLLLTNANLAVLI